MKVNVFVKVTLDIKGKNKLEEVKYLLGIMDDIVKASELESDPTIEAELVTDAEIFDTEE